MDTDGFLQLETIDQADSQILAAASAARQLGGKDSVAIEVLYPDGARKVAQVEFLDPPTITLFDPPTPPVLAEGVLAAGVAKLVELGLTEAEALAIAGVPPLEEAVP